MNSLEVFLITTLGNRIRQLRKERKMTLEALAGTELTKGMLSLIENNKANPSMESLTYIAKRLNVEVSELLDGANVHELRKVLEQVETIYFSGAKTEEELLQKLQSIKEKIEPIITRLSNDYESARLLDLYSRCLDHFDDVRWEDFSTRAATIYEQMNLSGRRANIGIYRAMSQLKKLQFEEALSTLLRERKFVEQYFTYIDTVTRLDLDYNEAILLLAVGKIDSAMKVLDEAILFSKKHKTFYRIDDLYRIHAAYAMVFRDEEKVLYYINKLKQYGEFADDETSIYFYHLINAELLMFRDHDYERALQSLNNIRPALEEKADVIDFGFLMMGKVLYKLGKYEESLQWLEKLNNQEPPYHPLDRSIFCMGDNYKALCYLELGQLEQAIKIAKVAKDYIDPLPYTPIKDFVNETFERIKDAIVKAAIEK